MIWGVGQHWQSARDCWAMLHLHNEHPKLSLMLQRTVDMKLLYRVCQSWYMPWGKQCAKQTLYKGVTFGVNLSKFFKCTMKSACIYGISYFSARAFLCQREGSAKKRSGSPRMGDFLYKLLCLCRIFEIEDTRYGFREMLGCRRIEKPPNWSFNSTKIFLS